jgi:hypothetical protein
MITRHVKLLIEAEVDADVNPQDIPAVLEMAFEGTRAYLNTKVTLVSVSELDDPFEAIDETPSRIARWNRLLRSLEV